MNGIQAIEPLYLVLNNFIDSRINSENGYLSQKNYYTLTRWSKKFFLRYRFITAKAYNYK